ncbi:MAG: DEAD/DEAH box helicase [Hyphomicrobium sp.]
METKTFAELDLSPKVQAAITAAGYTSPTPIQEAAIPIAVAGRDVLGIAQTGTGKTAAFVLPMITKLETGRARARMPRSLILEPTRELAAQVEQNFDKYGINHKLNVALLIGGVSMDEQVKKLDRGVDVLIATPGRLLDHFQRGRLMLMGVEILVIDEADRMLDMGFIPDIEKICKLLPPKKQTLFFSATMPPEITRLVSQFLKDPVRVEVAKPATTAKTITQKFRFCPGGEDWEKRDMLRAMIREEGVKNAIIFCNRKVEVAVLLKSLLKHGFNAGALHGDMDQKHRMETLDKFRSGEITLLAASDVAARGLDIPDVSHVFNFDLPWQSDDYVHRIGRTGRAGKQGTACAIVTTEDLKSLKDIEKMLGSPVEWIGEAPSEDDYASAGKRRRGRGGSRRDSGRDSGRSSSRDARPQQGRGREGGDRPGRHDHAERAAGSRERPRHAATHGAAGIGEQPETGTHPRQDHRTEKRPDSRPDHRNEQRADQRPRDRENRAERPAARGGSPQPQSRRETAPAGPRSEPQRQPRGEPPRDRGEPQQPRAKRAASADADTTRGQGGAGFADNVPAFLRKPPRPARVANE